METGLRQLEKLRQFMASRMFVAGRRELLDEGFGPERIRNWILRGRLVPVIHGVYSLGRDIETGLSAMKAALVSVGPGAVLTGQSACEVWGLVKAKTEIPHQIDVATESGQSRKLRGISPNLRQTWICVVKRSLEPNEVRQKRGLALVRPAMALIDLAVNAAEVELRFAFLEACRLGLFNEGDLKYCFKRLEGRRGAAKLRPYLELWVPELGRIRSVLEGWFLLEWIERKLPMPEVNEKVFGYEVDMLWLKYGVVLELDGDAFHSDPVQRKLDREKQRYLESRGLVVIRVTYKEFAENPAAVIARVVAALGN